jgi:FlaA1/EpsC-like NDP-sugar epimerase
VRVEDLLRRPTATEHGAEVADVFPGKVVLITGAGGSIGSELARQVMALRPRRLILLDRAESALFDIHRQLAETYSGSGVELHPELANVSSRAAIQRIIQRERPNVILHAAAYKHVPMMEQHPSDAIHVNVAGTMALLDAAAEAGVDRFVLVSTDKAVKPSSVMGASKRVAEMLVADTARRTGRPYVSVRFGNVLGSNGSVVPIFTDQLERGRPLTITHPDMTRYFMTIPEASWLILDAAALGQPGDLFVLDMGEPIRIMDLARDVTRLAGRDPDSQPIEITGLRPGEKLHEELFYDLEQVVPTSSPKVMRALGEEPPTDIRACVGRLLEYATGTHDDDLRAELARVVGGIQGPPESEADERVAFPVLADPVRATVAEPVLAEGA